jgi:4-amino-4-deoxy-L-arabinose transferase-like glycosyltransferase
MNAFTGGFMLKGMLTLFVFSLFLNLPYIHLREFQGEEGRRVNIAQTMIETDEWIVPYVEGKVYLKKPPCFNWLLAGAFRISGTISETSARMLSVLAAFLCALSLSLFWRRIADIKNMWFILPGLIFLTFTDVMDKAIRAEIDMTFTFFVTLSLVLWFYYFEFQKKELAAWTISLSFLSIGILTKGIQAPAFFYCGVIPYLFYKRRIKTIFSFPHATGIFVSLIIFAVWFVPFTGKIGFTEVAHAWFREIIARKDPIHEAGFLRHFVEFPLQYIIAYLPWIPLLLLWSHKPLRKEPEIIKDLSVYCLFFLLVSVPVYWLMPGARLRYVLPLSGALAILISIPVNALISGKIENSTPVHRYMQALGFLLFLLVIASPFWGKKFELFGRTFSVTLLIVIFFVSLLLIRWRTDFKRKVVLLLLTTLLVKTLWASFYFPYHADNLSHSRNAAGQINMLVPRDVALYDYRVDNDHLAYYLKRPVLLIEALDDVIIKNGSVVFMEDNSAKSLSLKGLSYMATVKARGMTLLLYRIERHDR